MGPEGSNTHVSTRVMGTYGYAAPEYISTGKINKSVICTYFLAYIYYYYKYSLVEFNQGPVPTWDDNLN